MCGEIWTPHSATCTKFGPSTLSVRKLSASRDAAVAVYPRQAEFPQRLTTPFAPFNDLSGPPPHFVSQPFGVTAGGDVGEIMVVGRCTNGDGPEVDCQDEGKLKTFFM